MLMLNFFHWYDEETAFLIHQDLHHHLSSLLTRISQHFLTQVELTKSRSLKIKLLQKSMNKTRATESSKVKY